MNKVGFPGDTVVKNSSANAGYASDVGSVPESRRFPGIRMGNLLQHSSLESSTDICAWWATVHGDAKNQTQLSD